MALATSIESLIEWRPFMRNETWKQIFQKHEESIPGSLRRPILDKCEKIERLSSFWFFRGKSASALRKRYEDFGTEVLSSTDIIDWENVAEHLDQMYDEFERAIEDERLRLWIREQAFCRIPTFLTQSYEETILKHAGQSLQGDVEPNPYFGTNSTDDQEPKRKIRIKVKNVNGVEYVFKEASTHDLILNLKCKIASKVGNMTEDEIILLYGDREMCDNDTLESYGITTGETVFMLHSSRGKGLMETARHLCSEALNVLKYLGEWVPALFADRTRAVSLIEICKVSQEIGKNWEFLGPALGLNEVEIDQITDESPDSTVKKIYKMLQTWLNKNQSEATVGKLYRALKECKQVRMNWTNIKNIFSGVDAIFTQG